MLTRRTFVQLGLALQAAGLLGSTRSAEAAELKFGPAQPFSFERLIERARDLGSREYVPPPRPDPDVVAQIDYDAHGKLHFRPEYALWGDYSSAFPITFKTVGKFFPKTVRMHTVENGEAREILYDPAYFTVRPDSPLARLAPEPSAFAGFWVAEPAGRGDWQKLEPWTTFLGASYFRAVGELGQVGLSARGVAIAPGAAGPEEFPDFIGFWLEKSTPGSNQQTVYALLDGPSIAGAYRFVLKRTAGTVMDISARLFPRRVIDRLGIAPVTSMYWFSETMKSYMIDWRPEVHDCDGLQLWTGAGEHIWRPLNNPRRITVSSFVDDNPRGFGLMQRDRIFNHYQDGVRYEDRPSAWVEPLGGWGRGAVQLVEIPTDDEIHDNIVAIWVPERPHQAGSQLDYDYRLHWLDDEPYPSGLGRCVATRIGRAGRADQVPRPIGRKFMIDFAGKALDDVPPGTRMEPVVRASRGEVVGASVEPAPSAAGKIWRVQFDLLALTDGAPIELRCFLRNGEQPLTETWLFQFDPGVVS